MSLDLYVEHAYVQYYLKEEDSRKENNTTNEFINKLITEQKMYSYPLPKNIMLVHLFNSSFWCS